MWEARLLEPRFFNANSGSSKPAAALTKVRVGFGNVDNWMRTNMKMISNGGKSICSNLLADKYPPCEVPFESTICRKDGNETLSPQNNAILQESNFDSLAAKHVTKKYPRTSAKQSIATSSRSKVKNAKNIKSQPPVKSFEGAPPCSLPNSSREFNSTAVRLLKKIEEMRKDVHITRVIELNTSGACSCGAAMAPLDGRYACAECGQLGSAIETVDGNTRSEPTYTVASNGRFDSLDDAFNTMYTHTFNRLQKRNQKNPDYHIPQDILRDVARAFAEICQTKSIGDDVCQKQSPEQLQCESTDDMPPQKAKKHRHNLVIHSLLQNYLDKCNMSKTDAYIRMFLGISKSKLTKSKNKLHVFIRAGDIAYVHPHDRIPSFVYQFLANLGQDTQYTDIAVQIIRRADMQVDMVRYRTCQDNSKVVGAIYVLMRQLGKKISHADIRDHCERISKSTYIRYVSFIDLNRRRFNPILVRNRIRPIPTAFAKSGGASKRDSHVLAPMPEKYKGMFIGW